MNHTLQSPSLTYSQRWPALTSLWLYLYPTIMLSILELGCWRALHRVTDVSLVRGTSSLAVLLYLVTLGIMRAVQKHQSPKLYSQLYGAMALVALAFVLSLK